MQCCALRKQQTPATLNGGDRGGVWIPLFSGVTLFEYNVLTIWSAILGLCDKHPAYC